MALLKFPSVKADDAIGAGYRKKIKREIRKMNSETTDLILKLYKRNEDGIAFDESPAEILAKALRGLRDKFSKSFTALAKNAVPSFVSNIMAYVSLTIKKRFGRLGKKVPTVKLESNSKQMRDIIKAIVHENVQLIKSIPQEYLEDVEQVVLEGVINGRDQSLVAKTLESKYGVARRRAELISRDQNDKATQSITMAKERDLGITKAIWRHSGAGKEPRPSHVAADGKVFDIRKGLKIEGEYIFPAQKINCRCTSEPIFDEEDFEDA